MWQVDKMAIRSILSRFREISNLDTTEFSDGTVTTFAEPIALAYFNEVMDESLTITTHSTGDDFADEILSWLVTVFAFQELYRTRMHKDSGMLEWEWIEQQAFRLMYARNPTKVEFNSANGIYIVRAPDIDYSTYNNIVMYRNEKSSYQYGE